MSFTRLRYHIVTTTKRRKPWITPAVEKIVYETMRARAEALKSRVVAIGGIEDHVHLLAAIPPHKTVSSTIGHLKSASAKAVHRTFQKFDHFEWQVGFSAFTISPGDVPRVASYVRHQKVRHKNDTLWEHFETTTSSSTPSP